MKAKTNKPKGPLKMAAKRVRHIVKMVVVPHKKNDYRPHLIRRYGLTAVLVFVIGLQFSYNGAVTGDVLGLKCEITTSELLAQTNKMRVSYGIGEVKLNDKLNQAAYLKAKDMFTNQYWAHVSPNGTQPWKWFGDVGYNYSEAGENLAKNFTTTSAAMTAWMNSPGHRANILEAGYQEVGFAVVSGELDGEETSIVVELFGTPVASAVASANQSFSQPGAVTNASVLTKFAIATQSVTSAAVIGMLSLIFATVVAGVSHLYRRKLPKDLRSSWYRHHGLYKAAGLSAFSLVMLFLYSGGQI